MKSTLWIVGIVAATWAVLYAVATYKPNWAAAVGLARAQKPAA